VRINAAEIDFGQWIDNEVTHFAPGSSFSACLISNLFEIIFETCVKPTFKQTAQQAQCARF